MEALKTRRQFTLTLERTEYRAIEHAAAQKGVPISEFIRKLLLPHVARLEKRWPIASEALSSPSSS